MTFAIFLALLKNFGMGVGAVWLAWLAARWIGGRI